MIKLYRTKCTHTDTDTHTISKTIFTNKISGLNQKEYSSCDTILNFTKCYHEVKSTEDLLVLFPVNASESIINKNFN